MIPEPLNFLLRLISTLIYCYPCVLQVNFKLIRVRKILAIKGIVFFGCLCFKTPACHFLPIIHFNCPKKLEINTQRILRTCQCLYLKMWAFGCHGERDPPSFRNGRRTLSGSFPRCSCSAPSVWMGCPRTLSLALEKWHHNEMFTFDVCLSQTWEPSCHQCSLPWVPNKGV